MKELIKGVQKLRDEELKRASEKFGKTNNSDHESYAVIKEEFDESQEEVDKFEDAFDAYWEAVKLGDKPTMSATLVDMQNRAELAAAEMIQVAAMCQKAIYTCWLGKQRPEKGEQKDEN